MGNHLTDKQKPRKFIASNTLRNFKENSSCRWNILVCVNVDIYKEMTSTRTCKHEGKWKRQFFLIFRHPKRQLTL